MSISTHRLQRIHYRAETGMAIFVFNIEGREAPIVLTAKELSKVMALKEVIELAVNQGHAFDLVVPLAS